MAVDPTVGERGGQRYDLEKAIQTFLQQMAEGSPNVVPAVIKELLQNADDAGATEVAVMLDERRPPAGLPQEYRVLYWPALLVRNNAPFRLQKEIVGSDRDDFSALCDVASGHKRAQAIAAGRFGIGFNSVYFLTDTPVLFSRREVHVFDILHHMFDDNGWRFDLDQFPAAATTGAGPIKNALEWMLPKKALGESLCFGDFAMSADADYRQAVLRLPLRQSEFTAKALYVDTFDTPEGRRSTLDELVTQAAQSVLFLKSVETVTFTVLNDANCTEEVARVEVSPNPPTFQAFLEGVKQSSDDESAPAPNPCQFDRTI